VSARPWLTIRLQITNELRLRGFRRSGETGLHEVSREPVPGRVGGGGTWGCDDAGSPAWKRYETFPDPGWIGGHARGGLTAERTGG